MKMSFLRGLTAAVLLAAGLAGVSADSLVAAPVAAAAMPVPVAVMSSEAFEAVGRLTDAGLVWWIDRADSNAPVLGAALEVEAGGKAVQAVFRAEQGDYLIADAAWLRPLRQPGAHPLALTLIAGDDSDLLAGELVVAAPALENGPQAGLTAAGYVWGGALGLVLLLMLLVLGGLAAWRRSSGSAA